MRTRHQHRSARKGSIMAVVMLMMVVVAIAGTAMLSMSTIHRIQVVQNGIDVRLMIASEAGIETVRGRFTLVQGVQDDWNFLSAAPAWTAIQTVNVNGINVQVDAQPFGGPSVPTARVRARAVSGVRARTVEYMIKVASFSDYAVFTGQGGTLGANYKMVGNYYSNGSLSIPYTGAQLFGNATLTGTISKTNGESDAYTYPVSTPIQNATAIPFPTAAAPWAVLESVAATTGYVWGENTLEIRFDGTQMHRTYVRRNSPGTGSAAGFIPSGLIWDGTNGWLNTSNGTRNYNSSTVENTSGTIYYECVTETLDIPDEGVIYIATGAAMTVQTAIDPGKDCQDATGDTNAFVQNPSGSTWSTYTTSYATGARVPILLMSGRIDDRRVTIACEHKIVVRQPIIYDTLLNDPSLRRFYNDATHSTGKESQTALNFKEMLGVCSMVDVQPAVLWWQDVDANFGGGGTTYDAATPEFIAPPHYPSDTYCMDGVFLALGATAPWSHYGYASGTGPLGEMWFHGGLIAQWDYGGGNGNTFYRRNYDWDFRMRLTTPPYFLRAYNTSATFIPGTWRTYES